MNNLDTQCRELTSEFSEKWFVTRNITTICAWIFPDLSWSGRAELRVWTGTSDLLRGLGFENVVLLLFQNKDETFSAQLNHSTARISTQHRHIKPENALFEIRRKVRETVQQPLAKQEVVKQGRLLPVTSNRDSLFSRARQGSMRAVSELLNRVLPEGTTAKAKINDGHIEVLLESVDIPHKQLTQLVKREITKLKLYIPNPLVIVGKRLGEESDSWLEEVYIEQLPCSFKLPTDREITIVRMEQMLFYQGLVAGVPNRTMTTERLESVSKYCRDVYNMEPFIIKPEEEGIDDYSVQYPGVVCIALFNSGAVVEELEEEKVDFFYKESKLLVVWFQETFSLHLDERAREQLGNAWNQHATDGYGI